MEDANLKASETQTRHNKVVPSRLTGGNCGPRLWQTRPLPAGSTWTQANGRPTQTHTQLAACVEHRRAHTKEVYTLCRQNHCAHTNGRTDGRASERCVCVRQLERPTDTATQASVTNTRVAHSNCTHAGTQQKHWAGPTSRNSPIPIRIEIIRIILINILATHRAHVAPVAAQHTPTCARLAGPRFALIANGPAGRTNRPTRCQNYYCSMRPGPNTTGSPTDQPD